MKVLELKSASIEKNVDAIPPTELIKIQTAKATNSPLPMWLLINKSKLF